ncbi:3-oxoacyl-[acyl-carrier-protein] synthase III C-terminal domain-containing protein [Streptomyces tsukubensis]|uniref:3-oxoacyl-ACP synthase n=1 Tax=Streptomyces tsukubensis TaxID=83656 RepID=A0A1V3ZZY4_9ACTN|nr:3-oxoacyl-[acyl-carrier-protein] synthase III C-terminal domain-containing protein [Streptomyces tsukubensis]OON71552.1 3-oxoacyl-ACP synthase [Streptomyces tsukubensis]QFR96708.1 3-oxoacyl-ACP synthase [Streptomyces tsukubensis]
MDYGLISFGSALGEPAPVADIVREYTEDVERVLEYGYRNIHRSPEAVGLTDLAEEAARAALAESGTDPGELDLVVLAITDIAEYLYWDPAAALQARLGAHRAEAVLVSQGCVGGITSFDLLAGRFATHPDYRRALVVGVNRTCEVYWNRMETHSLLFSDGAGAAVAGRGHPRLRPRAAEVISDGRYADLFLLEEGGAAAPFLGGKRPGTARDAWDLMEFFDYDADRFEAFVDLMNDRVREVVARACGRVGASVSDLSRVVLLNDNIGTLTKVADRLGVPLDRTNAAISMERGHFGAADHLLDLQHHLASGDLGEGDLVALAGMGRGMHWGCTLIEV